MELYAMIYQRLSTSQELAALLATYNGGPAVFYQRPATADDPGWGEMQYPRVDYVIDMQENPARNANGALSINVWCDTEYGAEPEGIESVLRELLHATFAQTDKDPCSFAWVRSDSFEVKTQGEETVKTIGVTMTFDIIAFPSQSVLYPDPVKAMNEWTKTVLPTATVIGRDAFSGWLVPTRDNPAIYWRMADLKEEEKHFTMTWMTVGLEGSVCARNADDRLYNINRLHAAQALAGHIPMEDTSPLFLKVFMSRPHLNYLAQGQIHLTGAFGLLQPESHIVNRSTGQPLNHAYPLCEKKE